MQLVIVLLSSVCFSYIKGRDLQPPNYFCDESNSVVEFTLSESSHSAWNPSSNCSLQQCFPSSSNSDSCRSSSTPCFDYRTLNNSRYCAPAIQCSILESCNSVTYTCASNTSVCINNSCCLPHAVCLPLSATNFCVLLYPPYLDVEPGTVNAVWNTFAGGSNTLATAGTDTGTYVVGSGPDNLFDGSLTSRYTSRGIADDANLITGLNTGFFMTVAQCQPVLLGFEFGNAYNYTTREPLFVTIEGTNCADVTTCSSWTLLYDGSTGLDIAENMPDYGDYESIWNSAIFQSYRFLITGKRANDTLVSYSEIVLYGYTSQTTTSQSGSSNSTSLLTIQSGSVQALWNTTAFGISTIATAGRGVGTYPLTEPPDNIFDENFNTKFSSRGNSSSGNNSYAGLDTGFYITVAQCQPTFVQFRFATANNESSSNRDPITLTVEGTNCITLENCITWILIYDGETGLRNVTDRSTFGSLQSISSPQSFTSYRFLITTKRDISDYVAYSEVELYGY